ncbi:MAG TPA: lipid-A-disaccharide synthase [Thermoanaerobaculia bacterium]|nr:lipid-A-disaccharide synthase [Thermoanaerobaculia bacterium]
MKLLVSAGEVSGDQHAAALLDALRVRVPGLETLGVAGDRCAARGMRLLAHQKDLAVVGLVEAIGKLRFAARLVKRLVSEAVRERVDGAVLVDSPDFNIPLARRLVAAGVPVVFFVSPQVWAWRASRAKEIARLGRAILVLFGFEKRWYEARGLGRNLVWVGHPLVDEAAEELASVPPAPAGKRRVVLMPGSRSGEIRRNLPPMRDAVETLRAARPELDVVLVRADSVPETLLAEVAGSALERWTVVSGPHLALLAASDALLVASGTATVEGLLARVPMVVVYRVHPLTFFLARRLVKVPHVAMANIVSDDGGGRAVPELIQKEATPERIAAELAAFLDDPALAARTRERLAKGAADLGPPGAAARAAEAVLEAFRGAAGAAP